MTETTPATCLTCYGVGETVTEDGPQACPDCFGEGRQVSHGCKIEWRLREIERTYIGTGRQTEADVVWLVNELRRQREALMRILARCQDADESNATAYEIKYQANEALGLYEPRKPS